MRFRKGNFKAVTILFFALMISSCSRKINPVKGYQTLILKTLDNLNKTSVAPTNLKINQDYAATLNTDDLVFISDSISNIYSYYKIFNVTLDAEKHYRISVSSLCDCFGFKKYIIIPVTSTFDSQNKYVNTQYEKDKLRIGYDFGPLSINTSYILDSGVGGDFKLLVFSANKNIGKNVYSFLTIPIPITINIKSTFVGKFHIKIKELP